MSKITFLPDNVEVEAFTGETIFDAANRIDVDIPTACNGMGNCGLCVVKIITGKENISPTNNIELSHLGNTFYITQKRLSCQCICEKDGEIVVRY